MHALSQWSNLREAGLAAVLTTAASWPQLAVWQNRPQPLVILTLTLFWAAFCLWAFVFAWHEKESGCKVFALRPPKFWLGVTLCGLGAALLLRIGVDPFERGLNLVPVPASFQGWLAGALFMVTFQTLFGCLAAFAFFIRLCHRIPVAAALTVGFGLFIFILKLSSVETHVSFEVVTLLVIVRAIVSFVALCLYLRGGAPAVGWWVFLLQTRYLTGS